MNGGAEEDRTPDPLRARQVLSQLSYDPFFLLWLFGLLFVIDVLSFGHMLTHAPSLFLIDASIKTKIQIKNLTSSFSSNLRFSIILLILNAWLKPKSQ